MRCDRFARAIPAIGLGLALSCPMPAPGQGLSPSSGSGAGTGTGMSSGFPGSTGTGRESTSGLGTTGTGREGMGTNPLPRALPGDNLTRPIDRRGLSGLDVSSAGGLSTVSPDLFLEARSVTDPGERALALVRIAQTAVFSKQLDTAHQALVEATPAALAEPDRLIREQRMTAIIRGLLSLAEERMSESGDIAAPSADETPAPPPAISPGVRPSTDPTPPPAARPPDAPPDTERRARLQTATTEWGMAVDLATRIDGITARTEILFRIVESEAFSSQRLITDPLRLVSPPSRPDPAKLSPEIRAYTDNLMASAALHARLIERPIWRNYAAYSIISNAAASSQFARGFEIARGIDQPEARTDALIRLAEGQALNGRPSEATAAYGEAARAVALIPQDDPRETLIGVLVDSLVSFGRFDDARACVSLYNVPARQVVALSAIAESQGRRGLAESARIWIGREAPPAYRPLLYRKVNDGILAGIELNRNKELTIQGR